MPSTIDLRPVKKSVIIVCLVSIACRALGMTFAGDHANIFEDGSE
jgi:hypothetical protein